MFNIVVSLFVLSAFLSYGYSIPTMTVSSALQPVQAQETPESSFDITGLWQDANGTQIYVTQTGSDVIATYYPDAAAICEGDEGSSETDFFFKGTIEGNQITGEESTWCYYDSPNPEENGLFVDPFEVTISDDGNEFTLFSTSRFGVEQSLTYSKISIPEGVEGGPPSNQGSPGATQPGNTFNSTLSQAQSTVEQFGNTFTTTLSEAENPMSLLQQNNLPTMIVFAGLVVAAIGGAAAYAKSKSSKRSQHKGGNVAVITRGGIQ